MNQKDLTKTFMMISNWKNHLASKVFITEFSALRVKHQNLPIPALKGLNRPDWNVGDRGFVHRAGIQFSKKQIFLPLSLVKIQYCAEEVYLADKKIFITFFINIPMNPEITQIFVHLKGD